MNMHLLKSLYILFNIISQMRGKMLLHLNGSFPNVPALKSFWEMSAKQKLEILTEEI
jgi:hypothetical protein